jgi:uncharacterized Rossmann fold enzyme
MPWIRRTLGLSNDDERIISQWIKRGLDNPRPVNLSDLFSYPIAVCFGAGPNLEEHIEQYLEIKTKNHQIITVDGATKLSMEYGVKPDIILSDLDGLDFKDLTYLADYSTIMILAHSDNNKQLEQLLDGMITRKNIIFCTQGKPIGNWVNTLGFTDGDRAIALCVQNEIKVLPLGFDLYGNIIGKASKPHYNNHQPIDERKRVKLFIAEKIFNWLNQGNLVFTVDTKLNPGTKIDLNHFFKKLA